jgi:hypothetical protein
MRHFERKEGSRYLWRDSTAWAHGANPNADMYLPGKCVCIYEGEGVVVLKWKIVEDFYPEKNVFGELMFYDSNIRDILSRRYVLQLSGLELDDEIEEMIKEKQRCST